MNEMWQKACADLAGIGARIDAKAVQAACDRIVQAQRIMLYGCGREALQLRGFAMRLHHLGREVAMQGDMTAPPLGAGARRGTWHRLARHVAARHLQRQAPATASPSRRAARQGRMWPD